MILCNKGHKTILATGTVTDFELDAEPYEADVEEDVEMIEAEISVGIHYCPECREVVDAWIENTKPMIEAEIKQLKAQNAALEAALSSCQEAFARCAAIAGIG